VPEIGVVQRGIVSAIAEQPFVIALFDDEARICLVEWYIIDS
jgi:hypothetical protein